MATSAILRYNMNKITCYLDHPRVAQCSASSGFNSVYDQPYAVVDYFPNSGTKNFAQCVHMLWIFLYGKGT
jgi:hypothetical protein